MSDTAMQRAIANDLPAVTVMQVVEVVFRRGKGESKKDPVRMVRAYYSMDGGLIAEVDDWAYTMWTETGKS